MSESPDELSYRFSPTIEKETIEKKTVFLYFSFLIDRAGSPKNCVSHATSYSRYVSSGKRLIIFAYFFSFFSDEDCIQCLIIRSLKFSGIYNPKRKKSIIPILTWIHQQYPKGTVCSLYQKKTRNFTIFCS